MSINGQNHYFFRGGGGGAEWTTPHPPPPINLPSGDRVHLDSSPPPTHPKLRYPRPTHFGGEGANKVVEHTIFTYFKKIKFVICTLGGGGRVSFCGRRQIMLI